MKTFCLFATVVALGTSSFAFAGTVKMGPRKESSVKSVVFDKNAILANLKDGTAAKFRVDTIKGLGSDPVQFADKLMNVANFEVICQTKNGLDCEDGFVFNFGK